MNTTNQRGSGGDTGAATASTPVRLTPAPAALLDLLDPSLCDGAAVRCSAEEGIFDLLAPHADRLDPAATSVFEFYDRAPFPGYAPEETAATLVSRCRGAPFLHALDRAIGSDAVVLDAGCGTGQLAAMLALTGRNRTVLGLDGCRTSLREATRFRTRAGIPNLHLVRADLLALPLRHEKFDVVISRGVVHHTIDPWRAIDGLIDRVKPGGVFALGFYENVARFPHAVRRALFARSPWALRRLDPLLRTAKLSAEKERIWIADQYRHPLERLLPAPKVLRAIERRGLEWIRNVPPLESGEGAFDRTPRPRSWFATRLQWLLRGITDPDCGVVFLILRRN